MESANSLPHGASVSAGSSILGGVESLSRRRAISNIGRIVNGLRNSSSSRPRHMRSSAAPADDNAPPYSFLLPHERRRVVRSDPLPPSFGLDFSAPLPFFGSSSSPVDGSRRNWRRGRRLPRAHTHDADRRDSAASATSARSTSIAAQSTTASAPPLGAVEPCGTSDLTYSSASDDAGKIAGNRLPTPRAPRASAPNASTDAFTTTESCADNNEARSEHGEGGYASSFDHDDTRRCGAGCADRDEVVALRAEMTAHIREMRDLQEKYYIMLNASLQENFQATGALESRVDQLASRGASKTLSPHRQGAQPSTVLMWTVVDAFSAVLLWLISALIARPYEAFRRCVRVKEDAEEILVSRKSWRLSASKDLKTEYDRFSFGPPRRLSFREAEQWGM